MNSRRYGVGFGVAVLLPFIVAAILAIVTNGMRSENRIAGIVGMAVMATSGLPFVFLLRLPRWKKILSGALSLPISFVASLICELGFACLFFGNCPL